MTKKINYISGMLNDEFAVIIRPAVRL